MNKFSSFCIENKILLFPYISDFIMYHLACVFPLKLFLFLGTNKYQWSIRESRLLPFPCNNVYPSLPLHPKNHILRLHGKILKLCIFIGFLLSNFLYHRIHAMYQHVHWNTKKKMSFSL